MNNPMFTEKTQTKPKPPGSGLARLIAFFIFLQGVYYAISAEYYFIQLDESLEQIVNRFNFTTLFENPDQNLFLLFAILAIFCLVNTIDLFMMFRFSRPRALFCQSIGLFSFIFLFFSPIETQAIYLPMAFSITLVVLLNYQDLKNVLEERHGIGAGV